jgi:methylglyoxal/glyoxal reductase
MLIHWPGTQGAPLDSPVNKQNRLQTYKALEQAYKEGIVRSIGVSNYYPQQLDELKDADVPPMVLQMELHPLYNPSWVKDYVQPQGIVVTSYSTLGEGRFVNGSIVLESVKKIAEHHNVSMGCVLLRWAIQKGFTVIPKTSRTERLEENMTVIHGPLLSDEVAHFLFVKSVSDHCIVLNS